MKNLPTDLLKEWFLHNRRSLPWRENPTPYRVWISEIMLQQTQVAVVIPYFERWLENFPTISSLASAPLERVIKCWEGLGYYSRARNLHKAANYLVAHHQGELPSTKEELAKIPGIGPYTLGAIRSFAFRQKAAAVDGNVTRVLSRFYGYKGLINTAEAKKELHCYAEAILPDDRPWLVTEGLIELGATVCLKKAQCHACPLKGECVAYRDHLQELLPHKRKQSEITLLMRHVAVIQCKKWYFVQKRADGEVMADLYEFPYLDRPSSDRIDLAIEFNHYLGLKLSYLKPLPIQRHTFTRFRAELIPYLFEATEKTESHFWKSREELSALPFSSGHKRILMDL